MENGLREGTGPRAATSTWYLVPSLWCHLRLNRPDCWKWILGYYDCLVQPCAWDFTLKRVGILTIYCVKTYLILRQDSKQQVAWKTSIFSWIGKAGHRGWQGWGLDSSDTPHVQVLNNLIGVGQVGELLLSGKLLRWRGGGVIFWFWSLENSKINKQVSSNIF